MAETDISRVRGLIMENPKLIEEIKGLVEKSDEGGAEASAEREPRAIEVPTVAEQQKPRKRREELLTALKPYISDERRKAVESFVTIAEILELMREK